jgi:hypothetical protein
LNYDGEKDGKINKTIKDFFKKRYSSTKPAEDMETPQEFLDDHLLCGNEVSNIKAEIK